VVLVIFTTKLLGYRKDDMPGSFDKFLIAPFETGLETDLKPWLIPEDAFQQLNNAYIFRGRVRKRFGSSLTGYGATTSSNAQLFSRLRIKLTGGAAVGITDGAGAATGTVPGSVFKVGQIFSIGTVIYTVSVLGTPATMLKTDATTTCTLNTTTGVYAFNGAPATTQIYFYTSEPVMGLTQHESGTINDSPAVAFDTQFAYKFNGASWDLIGPTASQWHGSNSQFFWAANWTGLTFSDTYLFTTNFNATIGTPDASDDSMWYYSGAAWTAFNPNFFVAGDKIKTAKMIVPFKDRLVLFNTIEQNAAGTVNTSYKNRIRYSHNGSPLSATAWYEPNEVGASGGGWIDAPTEEEIISVEFIKDRLIVYFERSTWELAYTSNQVLPFLWQKINTEYGSDSMNSTVPFDKVVLTIGSRGIHACNGGNVERVDQKIPNKIFQVRQDNNGVDRVAGIRDYYTEMVYWAFPTANAGANSDIYPNKILVYNYKNQTWAFNDDCITAFGYFEQQLGLTWAAMDMTWEEMTFAWDSATTSPKFRQIIAGNQHGFVFIVSPEITSNAENIQITNTSYDTTTNVLTLTIIDHTLESEDYIKLTNVTGLTIGGDGIYQVTVVDADTISVIVPSCTGTYLGGGTVGRISNVNIVSKQWNFYLKEARSIYLSHIDFIIQKTENGQVCIDYSPSSSNISMIDEGVATGAIIGNSILETNPYPLNTMEETQDRLVHRVYFQADGTCVQIRIYLNDDQLKNPAIAESDFQLEGMIVSSTRTSEYE